MEGNRPRGEMIAFNTEGGIIMKRAPVICVVDLVGLYGWKGRYCSVLSQLTVYRLHGGRSGLLLIVELILFYCTEISSRMLEVLK